MKSTTDRLTQMSHHIERLELVVKWLVERIVGEADLPCNNCGHDIGDHLDDADGGEGCIFPMTLGAPLSLCRCLAFRSGGADVSGQSEEPKRQTGESGNDENPVVAP